MKEKLQEIQEKMIAKGWTLSTAESCTSGRIAALITTISGASGYFQGGIVAYQDRLKVQYLSVRQEDIDQHDVVSQIVVEQMVKGACQMFDTTFAIASTGYAGDGMNGIPAGTIWIAWGSRKETHSLCLHQDEGRESNTQHAVEEVIRRFHEWAMGL